MPGVKVGGDVAIVDGVAGVIVWTGDLDRLAAFYRDTLELTPHSVRPDFVAFRWGDMRLSVGTHSGVDGDTREPHRIMINLATSDIQAAFDRLTARGVRFVRPPEQEHWGGWVATFQDPDGNTLQLLQQPGA